MANPQTLLDGAFARRLERLQLVSRKRLVGQGQGDRRSLRKGSSLEFADYRTTSRATIRRESIGTFTAARTRFFVRLYEEKRCSMCTCWSMQSQHGLGRAIQTALRAPAGFGIGVYRAQRLESAVCVAAGRLSDGLWARLGPRSSWAHAQLHRRVQTRAVEHHPFWRASVRPPIWSSRWGRSPAALAAWWS